MAIPPQARALRWRVVAHVVPDAGCAVDPAGFPGADARAQQPEKTPDVLEAGVADGAVAHQVGDACRQAASMVAEAGRGPLAVTPVSVRQPPNGGEAQALELHGQVERTHAGESNHRGSDIDVGEVAWAEGYGV